MNELLVKLEKIIEPLITKPKNRAIFLKYIQTYPDDEAIRITYQIVSDLKLKQGSTKDVLIQLKNNEYGWNNGIYNGIRDKIKEADIYNEKPLDVEEGIMQCKKCSSKKTFSFSKQTRSGDESLTVFVRCTECKYQSIY